MKFSIIHASYGRPKLASSTKAKWIKDTSTLHELEYILSVDKSDHNIDSYEFEHGVSQLTYNSSLNMKAHLVLNDTNTSVEAINNAASKCTGDIIIVISDDFETIQNWDLEILKAVEGKEDWILKTQDGTQPWIITLPIMDRKYYERFGYIYPPEYKHLFSDTHLTHEADLNGRKLTSNLLFRHNHYSVGGIKKDATSGKADRTWRQGEETYLNKVREWQSKGIDVFNLPAEAKPHINWLKGKL